MLVMRTTEDPTDPVRKFISSHETVWFNKLALSVYPFMLDGVMQKNRSEEKMYI